MDDLSTKITKIKRLAWFTGNLRYLTRPGPQREAYDRIRRRDKSFSAFTPFVFNFHRRLGKTFLCVLLCIEFALRSPGKYIKFLAPSMAQAADILDEHWAIIMQECPAELEPDPFRGEKFTFRNPRWANKSSYAKSTLKLYGVNNDRGNKARGGSTDLAVLDECREMADLKYTWGSVLLPTFKGRLEPLALMISTPPDSMDHPWVSKYILEAREKGRYMCVPASEDPNWSKEEDDLFAREMGGRKSPEYRREIQCELVSDASSLIIPEFVQADVVSEEGVRNEFIEERERTERPEYYHAYTCGDMGGAGKKTDHTGIIAGYWDFKESLFYIEDETFLRDEDTRTIAWRWKKLVDDQYNQQEELDQGRHMLGVDWWSQCHEQQLVDFRRLYDMPARNVPTQDRDAARRFLRTGFSMGRIKIHPRCTELIYQLRNGQRLPSGDFQRSERLGHCDLIAALIGLYRVIDFEKNPYPPRTFPTDEYFVFPEVEQSGWKRYFRKRR